MSYASIASRNAGSSTAGAQQRTSNETDSAALPVSSREPRKRSPSPSHIPKAEGEGENVYIVTLVTDKGHHRRMTALRDEYFPKRINKLAAHLTLFHALPESKLESSIIPVIEEVAAGTTAFHLHAKQPFRLKHGIAISISDDEGGRDAQIVHGKLQRPWLKGGFLSKQDSASKLRLHYTIMNKVDEHEVVDQAFEKVESQFAGDWGVVEGLGLYLYDRGRWKWQKTFPLRSEHPAAPDNTS